MYFISLMLNALVDGKGAFTELFKAKWTFSFTGDPFRSASPASGRWCC
ncbi:MAG: hypothetical protein ACLS4Z_05290 [Christensenellaceae bacterium]